MKNDVVIKFDKVTKTYKLYKNDKKRLIGLLFKNMKCKENKAVNNVSFEIKRGECVALFGKNGAGKSTILKLITEVTYPTEGKITVNGRVSALLELTSGFDPEFTGRENIYLKGQLLGLKDKEAFRGKCVKKVNEITSKEDVTLLFVTHATDTARDFCKRGIVMQQGKAVFDGDIEKAISEYHKIIYKK